MEIISIIISLGAFIIASVSLIWQLLREHTDLNVEVIDIFKYVGELGSQYIFRIHFINNSPSPISVSQIIIKNKSGSVEVEYDRLQLIREFIKNNKTVINNSKTEVIDEIVAKGYLYSMEFPFRIDGDGSVGGYFFLVDSNEELTIEPYETLQMIIRTNKKSVFCQFEVKNLKSWDDIYISVE